ncbi:MAG: rod shape-determining protein MreC [Breznakia sp.]
MAKHLTQIKNEIYKFTRIQKILISICGFLLVFGIVARVSGGNAVSKAGYDIFTMFRHTLIENPAKTITNFTSDLTNLWKVKSENEELMQTLASQKNYEAQADEAKRRLKEIETLMDMHSTLNYDATYANVLVRDMEGWSNELTIDKGSKDGIEKNTAVISSEGLIGRVSEVHASSSKIKLLTTENKDNSVAISVDLENGSLVNGILENYDKEKGEYQIHIFESNSNIKSGMRIITSGNSEVFPPGILVGMISTVDDLYNAKGKVVMANPAVNFSDFNYVAVLGAKK